MAAHTTKTFANYGTLATATSTAMGYTVTFEDAAAPTVVPNSMVDCNWAVEDSAGTPIPFTASYEDMDTTIDLNRTMNILVRALGLDGVGGIAQTNFAAAAAMVAAADAPEALGVIWAEMQDLEPDVLGIRS